MIEDYYSKSMFIEDTIQDLTMQNKIEDGLEENNINRISKVNLNNLLALKSSLASGEPIGGITFWLLKKTVDKNLSTIESILDRKLS